MLTPPNRGPMPSGTAAKSNEADPTAIRSQLQMIINSRVLTVFRARQVAGIQGYVAILPGTGARAIA